MTTDRKSFKDYTEEEIEEMINLEKAEGNRFRWAGLVAAHSMTPEERSERARRGGVARKGKSHAACDHERTPGDRKRCRAEQRRLEALGAQQMPNEEIKKIIDGIPVVIRAKK